MAIVYGDKKAGQFAKRRAHDRTRQIWGIVVVVCLMGGLTLGFLVATMVLSRSLWALRFAHRFWILFLAIEIAVGTGLLAAIRRLDKLMNDIYRERIKWLRGGQAEGLVAWHLQELSNDWHVFHNVMRDSGWDIDHVLVGPAGIFTISTKAQRGYYSRQNGGFRLNNQPTDHVDEAVRMAMKLKDRLYGLAGEVPWIQGVLAVPFAYVDFPPKQNNVWVLHERDLISELESAPKKLAKADIARFAKAVEMIHQNAGAIVGRGSDIAET
jgi:hypothetical protein